jgi:hypothetical protein
LSEREEEEEDIMAAPVALNAAFIRMGFSAEAMFILAAADKENLIVESLHYMDGKTVETLCASLCKQGGMVDGPALPSGAPIPQIRDPGVYVSTRAEINLKTSCYMVRHYACTSQVLDYSGNDIRVQAVQGIRESVQGTSGADEAKGSRQDP